MEKYKIIQLCDSMTQTQTELVIKCLNDGYFILADYKFTNTAILILQLEEKEGLSIKIDREKLNAIIENQSKYRETPERDTTPNQ